MEEDAHVPNDHESIADQEPERSRKRTRSISSERSVVSSSSKIGTLLANLLSSKKRSRRNSSKRDSTKSYMLRSTELKWRSDLDKRQFEFNEKIIDSLKPSLALLSVSTDTSATQAANNIKAAIDALHQRQKLIRFAERSTTGWASAYEYEKDDLADDSEDERRLRAAEGRASRKRKEAHSVSSRRFSASANHRAPFGWRQVSKSGPRRFSPPRAARRPSDNNCFKCGQGDHWANKCPNNGAASRSK